MSDIKFTPEEEKLIQRAAYAAFEYAAQDIDGPIKRRDAIEIALDAGRTEQQLRSRKRHERLITDELIQRVQMADYALLQKIVRPAFQYASYD